MILDPETQHTVWVFDRFLKRGWRPPLTVGRMLALSPDERQLLFPGHGPLDRACDYSAGMGV